MIRRYLSARREHRRQQRIQALYDAAADMPFGDWCRATLLVASRAASRHGYEQLHELRDTAQRLDRIADGIVLDGIDFTTAEPEHADPIAPPECNIRWGEHARNAVGLAALLLVFVIFYVALP